jgi:hypothetical protein
LPVIDRRGCGAGENKLGPSDSTKLLFLRQNRGGTGEPKTFALTDDCSFEIKEWDQSI